MSASRTTAKRIDPARLHAAIEALSREQACALLVEAFEFVPQGKLARLVGRHIPLDQLRPDPPGLAALCGQVKAFEQETLAGDYYEGFKVNSRNFMDRSPGTRRWIATCERLVERCAAAAASGGDARTIGAAFEILLGLLAGINEGENIIFFADEGGAWQVGVDWRAVLPAYFACLSTTAQPEEYARRVDEVIDEFCDHDRDRHLAAARRVAAPAQRKALPAARKSRTRGGS